MLEYSKRIFAWLISLIISLYHLISPFPIEKVTRQQKINKEIAKLGKERGDERRRRDYSSSSKLWKQHMTRPTPRKRRA
ncbi:unnamed protein product [Thelazia callipaeda]|uniref:Uncharacterized protein n=1 Tax=Thelazia callipaeda TaxID=103827 RepID=A0A0N5CVJ6_THECL|nr:unnamed protein product [Thelazia callipaeda]